MKNISAALVNAQRAFSPALKCSTNPHFKSKYADLAVCVDAVIDALNDNGIYLIQKCHDCDNGVIVETVFIHESGEELSGGKLHVPSAKQDAQGYGSALTYARRYSLMAASGIAPEDDDGNLAARAKAEPSAKITAAHIANITALIDEVKANKDAFLKYCKLNAIEDMPLLQYPSAIKALEAKRKSA